LLSSNLFELSFIKEGNLLLIDSGRSLRAKEATREVDPTRKQKAFSYPVRGVQFVMLPPYSTIISWIAMVMTNTQTK